MSETASPETLQPQHDIELPNGVVASGMGGDAEVIQEEIEARHEERTGKPLPGAPEFDANSPRLSKKQREAQSRIDQEVGRTKEAIRRAEAAELKLRELEARPAATAQLVRETPKPQDGAAPTRTKPTEDEVGTKYTSYADFVEDLADWRYEQRQAKDDISKVIDARVAERIEADRASRSFTDSATSMVDRGRKMFTDFDAVRKDGAGSQVNLGPEKTAIILRLPNAERVIYEACKSAEVAGELLSITDPVEFGMRLARFSTETPAAQAAPAKVTVPMTNAAPPMQPVGTSSRTSSPSLEELASAAIDDYDNSGYRERRRSELKAARG